MWVVIIQFNLCGSEVSIVVCLIQICTSIITSTHTHSHSVVHKDELNDLYSNLFLNNWLVCGTWDINMRAILRCHYKWFGVPTTVKKFNHFHSCWLLFLIPSYSLCKCAKALKYHVYWFLSYLDTCIKSDYLHSIFSMHSQYQVHFSDGKYDRGCQSTQCLVYKLR